MAIRIFEPNILKAQGALLDLTLLARQTGSGIPKGEKAQRKLLLRWQTSPAAGLPSEPFKVWRRPARPFAEPKKVRYEVITVDAFLPANVPQLAVIQFAQPLASVSLQISANQSGIVSVGLMCGVPTLESLVTIQSRQLEENETTTMEFHSPLITSLVLINFDKFSDIKGVLLAETEKVDDWELVETVGLPVDEREWQGSGQRHGVKQGMINQETDAVTAAVQRFQRGINPLGWWPNLPDGIPAPDWQLPDPYKLVEESSIELLPMLRQVADSPPEQQAAQTFNFEIDPPQNPAGGTMPSDEPSSADLSPLGLLAMLAAGDPQLAVTLGYGTGYPEEKESRLAQQFNHSAYDWMITGLWENGLDGKSKAIEFAALVPRPGIGLPAPTPADLQVDLQAHLRPEISDQPWLASIRSSWQRFPQTQLTTVASFAAARHQVGKPNTAEALLEPRMLTHGYRPIINTRSAQDPEPTRQSHTDASLQIPPNPGKILVDYAIATQNIFGLWSGWSEKPIEVLQPKPAIVQILSADLVATDPGTGSLCPASLTFEFTVDWRIRSIKKIELHGRLFAAATRQTDPPNATVTKGIQYKLGGAITPVVIEFSGDTPTLNGQPVIALNAEGDAQVPPGPAQSHSRRYRVTIPGLELDYASTPHIGLRLRARVVERIANYRIGAWSPSPKIVYASDPRARPTQVIDLVRLASLPDAAGECHALLDWQNIPNAIGYAVYESTETRILTTHPGYPQPSPERSLSQRLTTLKQAFNAQPSRRDFTRKNAELLTANHIDVTLPRGSGDIHLYVILPVMAGGTEGPWPSGTDASKALIPYAAPRIAQPAPPTIELQLLQDKPPAAPNFRARLRIGTRGDAGARPKRIDIYRVRVDDAARQLDSMGPPIASLSASNAQWQVDTASGNWISQVIGIDQPEGSWRTVWYRAVAWADDDLPRGILKGRSLASPAASVVIPPATGPDLSPLSLAPASGNAAWVLVNFSSKAPSLPTPLGPHLINVAISKADGSSFLQQSLRLDQVASAQPASDSGLWCVAAPGSAPGQYRILVRRSSVDEVLHVTVRITDPIQRFVEQVIGIPAATLTPLPSLSKIDAFSIVGRGHIYTFSSNAPDQDASGGVYRIHVAAVAKADSPFVLLDPKRLSEIERKVEAKTETKAGSKTAGKLESVSLKSLETGKTLKLDKTLELETTLDLKKLLGQFTLKKGVFIFEGPLSSVKKQAKAPTLGTQSLVLYRQSADKDDNFVLLAKAGLSSLLVRITTPDGRSVEQRWKA